MASMISFYATYSPFSTTFLSELIERLHQYPSVVISFLIGEWQHPNEICAEIGWELIVPLFDLLDRELIENENEKILEEVKENWKIDAVELVKIVCRNGAPREIVLALMVLLGKNQTTEKIKYSSDQTRKLDKIALLIDCVAIIFQQQMNSSTRLRILRELLPQLITWLKNTNNVKPHQMMFLGEILVTNALNSNTDCSTVCADLGNKDENIREKQYVLAFLLSILPYIFKFDDENIKVVQAIAQLVDLQRMLKYVKGSSFVDEKNQWWTQLDELGVALWFTQSVPNLICNYNLSASQFVASFSDSLSVLLNHFQQFEPAAVTFLSFFSTYCFNSLESGTIFEKKFVDASLAFKVWALVMLTLQVIVATENQAARLKLVKQIEMLLKCLHPKNQLQLLVQHLVYQFMPKVNIWVVAQVKNVFVSVLRDFEVERNANDLELANWLNLLQDLKNGVLPVFSTILKGKSPYSLLAESFVFDPIQIDIDLVMDVLDVVSTCLNLLFYLLSKDKQLSVLNLGYLIPDLLSDCGKLRIRFNVLRDHLYSLEQNSNSFEKAEFNQLINTTRSKMDFAEHLIELVKSSIAQNA